MEESRFQPVAIKQYCIVFLAVCMSLNASSQKIQFKNSVEIPRDQISTKTKAARTVTFIKKSALKNGHNFMTLRSGNRLYVEFEKNEIKSFTLAKPDGTKIEKFFHKARTSKVPSCFDNYCVCSGDEDCNDMFSSGLCGDEAVCMGEICICVKN